MGFVLYDLYMAMNMHVKQAAKNLARAEADKHNEANKLRADLKRKESDVRNEINSLQNDIRHEGAEDLVENKTPGQYAESVYDIRTKEKRIKELESELEKEKAEKEQQIQDLENEARNFKQQADNLSMQA